MRDEERIADLAADIQCGTRLAYDLLLLAGGDESLVREASSACQGIASVKAYIVSKRLKGITDAIDMHERRLDLRDAR